MTPLDDPRPFGATASISPRTVKWRGGNEATNTSDDDPEGQTVAKFTQICASQNDLFALDEEGNIYQYDFSAKTWEKLVASRGRSSSRAAHTRDFS